MYIYVYSILLDSSGPNWPEFGMEFAMEFGMELSMGVDMGLSIRRIQIRISRNGKQGNTESKDYMCKYIDKIDFVPEP